MSNMIKVQIPEISEGFLPKLGVRPDFGVEEKISDIDQADAYLRKELAEWKSCQGVTGAPVAWAAWLESVLFLEPGKRLGWARALYVESLWATMNGGGPACPLAAERYEAWRTETGSVELPAGWSLRAAWGQNGLPVISISGPRVEKDDGHGGVLAAQQSAQISVCDPADISFPALVAEAREVEWRTKWSPAEERYFAARQRARRLIQEWVGEPGKLQARHGLFGLVEAAEQIWAMAHALAPNGRGLVLRERRILYQLREAMRMDESLRELVKGLVGSDSPLLGWHDPIKDLPRFKDESTEE